MKRYLVVAKIGGEVCAEMMLPDILEEFVKAGYADTYEVFDVDPNSLELRRGEVKDLLTD